MDEVRAATDTRDTRRRPLTGRAFAVLDRRSTHVVAALGVIPLGVIDASISNVAPTSPLPITVTFTLMVGLAAGVVYARVLVLAARRRAPGDAAWAWVMSLVSLPAYVIGIPLFWFGLGWAYWEAVS